MSLLKRPLILASSSPRRQYLMRQAGFEFTIEKPEVEETFPPEMPLDQVARFLAAKKAEYLRPRIRDEIVLTADTVVIIGNNVLNKPRDRAEACWMLERLAGRSHVVTTGVSIASADKEQSFDETTTVTFEPLSLQQIEYYVDLFKPYDKAGAYGAQDCLAPGIDPCTEEEREFLVKIGRPDLVKNSASHSRSGLVIIKNISGSYFNVMGLPIHKVYEHLTNW